jgi:tRNA pseudouridine55 synthase
METRKPDAGGLLLVDKPAGVTSHDVVAVVRRAAGISRVGHAGTLDPFATGLLVVLLGRGTRLIPYIDGDPKVYEAVIRFGAETDTDDVTGESVREAALPAPHAIERAIRELTGEIDQMPPAYSAKKIDGVRAYSAARRGAPLTLEASRVAVHAWETLHQSENELTVRITCNGGTYVRALARDLGRLAESAAHLGSLRRAQSGRFSVGDAVTLDDVRANSFALRPFRDAISDMPMQGLDDAELARVLHGNWIAAKTTGSRIALVDDEETLIAVAERAGDALKPTLVLRDE